MGEIIVFILIVLFLGVKLYGMFGGIEETSEDDQLRRKYAEYIWFFDKEKYDEDMTDDSDTITVYESHINGEKKQKEKTKEEKIEIDLKRIFSNFNIINFKRSAAKVYDLLFSTLSTGRLKNIQILVTPTILKDLKALFDTHKSKGAVLVNSNIEVKKIEIFEIVDLGDSISLTVNILAARCSYVAVKETGDLVSGNNNKITTFEEMWKFQKAKKSKDQAWVVSMIREK